MRASTNIIPGLIQKGLFICLLVFFLMKTIESMHKLQEEEGQHFHKRKVKLVTVNFDDLKINCIFHENELLVN